MVLAKRKIPRPTAEYVIDVVTSHEAGLTFLLVKLAALYFTFTTDPYDSFQRLDRLHQK
jgi:hypothetical protein